MVYICEDYLKRCARRQEVPLCQGAGGLQEGCRAGIWCAPISICCCPVPRLDPVERSNVGDHDLLCHLAQNDHRERAGRASVDTEPYYRQGPLAEVDHQLPATWTAYLSMRQEIRDPQVHHQLQQDLIEHLWRLKVDAGHDVW